MSVPRNFRIVLDVDPDSPGFHCVGTRKDGGPCGQKMFSGSNLYHASSLLTEMDGRPLKDSYRYLEVLAFYTLCPRWHRKPGYSQVREVTLRWEEKIQQLERAEAELEKKPAVRQTVTRRSGAAEEGQSEKVSAEKVTYTLTVLVFISSI